jgi:hypothetical protein
MGARKVALCCRSQGAPIGLDLIPLVIVVSPLAKDLRELKGRAKDLAIMERLVGGYPGRGCGRPSHSWWALSSGSVLGGRRGHGSCDAWEAISVVHPLLSVSVMQHADPNPQAKVCDNRAYG